nr:hypothetical protein [uncultured Leptotrichia sp.]
MAVTIKERKFEKETLKRIYKEINDRKRNYPYLFNIGETHYSTWIWNNEIKESMTKEEFTNFLKGFKGRQDSGISKWYFLTDKRARIFNELLKRYSDEIYGCVATFYEPFLDIYFSNDDFIIDTHTRRKQ